MIIRNEHNPALKDWYELSGIVNESVEYPKINWDIHTPARAFLNEVGAEKIRELHKASILTDVLIIILSWTLFIGLWIILATIPLGILWVVLGFIQTLVISNLFYNIRHDTFMHRQLGGAKNAYFWGILFSLPQMNTYTRFLRHEDHHVHVGYDLFEEHIAELDKVWKRWFCMSFIGLFFLAAGKLRSKNAPQANKNWKTPEIVKKASRAEGLFHLLWLGGIITGSILWPYQVLMGYVIPFVLFTPIVFSIKYALQHSETDIKNPFHSSVYIRSGFVLKFFYYYSLADIHLVHHIFPRIPAWKLGKAARLFHPVIARHDVPERSLWEVIIGYYFKGKPYRERWS